MPGRHTIKDTRPDADGCSKKVLWKKCPEKHWAKKAKDTLYNHLRWSDYHKLDDGTATAWVQDFDFEGEAWEEVQDWSSEEEEHGDLYQDEGQPDKGGKAPGKGTGDGKGTRRGSATKRKASTPHAAVAANDAAPPRADSGALWLLATSNAAEGSHGRDLSVSLPHLSTDAQLKKYRTGKLKAMHDSLVRARMAAQAAERVALKAATAFKEEASHLEALSIEFGREIE